MKLLFYQENLNGDNAKMELVFKKKKLQINKIQKQT